MLSFLYSWLSSLLGIINLFLELWVMVCPEGRGFTAYWINKFNLRNIEIDNTELEKLLIVLEGHPYYSMKTLQFLYYHCLEHNHASVNRETLNYALEQSILETKSYLEDVISRLKSKKHHYEVIYNLANKLKSKLSSVMLFKTLSSLEEAGIVTHQSRGNYTINDVFLKLYITEKTTGLTYNSN
jgi:hypothetical protein